MVVVVVGSWGGDVYPDFLVSISNDDLNRLCSANNIDIRINFVVARITSDQVLVSLTLFQCKVVSGLLR